MKIRLTTKRLVIIAIIVIVLAGTIWYQLTRPPEYYMVYIDGNPVAFRVDPKQAVSVPVYPDEETVYGLVRSPIITDIDIVFKPASEKDNPLYQIEGIEIVYKLRLIYDKWKHPPEFNPYSVDSYENLTGTIQKPIIAMVHPVYANETAIRVQNRTIFISGTNADNFDLATVKFLMIALNITNI